MQKLLLLRYGEKGHTAGKESLVNLPAHLDIQFPVGRHKVGQQKIPLPLGLGVLVLGGILQEALPFFLEAALPSGAYAKGQGAVIQEKASLPRGIFPGLQGLEEGVALPLGVSTSPRALGEQDAFPILPYGDQAVGGP